MKIELKTEYSTPNPDDVPLMAARGDYMSDSLVGKSLDEAMAGTDKTGPELIANLLRRGHFGPFEHIQAYFAVEGVSRVTMAQLTRHRHVSFDVQSMRYVDFSEKDPVVPPTFGETRTMTDEQAEQTREVFTMSDDEVDELKEHTYEDTYREFWKFALDYYRDAVSDGVPKEDARFFLPLGAPVNMTFSANARVLMHVIDLRKSGKAQWEIRDLAAEMEQQAREWAPRTFEAYDKYTNHNSLVAP